MEEELHALEFKTRIAWRSWLEQYHTNVKQAWLYIKRKGANIEGLSLEDAVEEALCFGWIDGTLRPVDEQRYLLRFSPRRRNSVWSVRNIQRVQNLTNLGKMTKAGLEAVEEGKRSGQWQAALDRERTDQIPYELEVALRRRKGAIAAYRKLPDSQKKRYIYWVQSAKRDQTKKKRIEEIIRNVMGE
jgi:uncharacterized protein YdeI (YjbR/CyaY-like superfamily)